MEGKKGFGKSSRDEGYRGASRGSRPAGPRSGKTFGAGARDGKTFGAGRGRSAEFNESWNADSADVRNTDGKTTGGRTTGGRTAAARGGKTFGAGARGGKTFGAGTRGGKTFSTGGGRPADRRGLGESGFRGASKSERVSEYSEKDRFDEYSGKDRVGEQRMPTDSDIAPNQGDLDKLEGRNSVLEALKAGRSINRIFVSKGEREGSVNQIIAMARQSHILIQEIDRAKLDDMSLTHAHQGVIALTAAKDYVEVDDILASAAESGRPPFIVILDEITDSHNLGSILRTANAAGVHGVIIPKRRAIGLTSVVSKASAGAIEYVPVARVTNIAQTIEYLKKQNIWVVGTDSTGEKSYFDSDLTGPVALVVGSEGEGMGKLVRESCDFVVNIPMMGQISSLNAAVAGAIVMYEILRQRSKKQL